MVSRILECLGQVPTVLEMIAIGWGVYVFKVVYEVIATPFSTRFANWLKKVEGVDKLDTPEMTNYSPLPIINK